jgi:hypothetical protein
VRSDGQQFSDIKGLHCISEDSFYMIPSLLGLHFSSIGVLTLSISALLAWAKIAVHALNASLHRFRQGSADVLRVPKIAVHQGVKEWAVDKPYEKGLWKE